MIAILTDKPNVGREIARVIGAQEKILGDKDKKEGKNE